LAQARISSEIAPTPLQYCPRLSEQTGCDVFLKREDLQGVRSYKIRGAFFSISNLSEEEKAAGIVTASAGNHAQALPTPAAPWASKEKSTCRGLPRNKSATASWFTGATWWKW